MTESQLLRQIQLDLSTGHDRLWRNNVGRLMDVRGTYVHYGLCVGSGDLIGLHSIVITDRMVGRRIAVFASVEGKSEHGRATKEQLAWIHTINSLGGLAGIARTVDEARGILTL